jgi:hypothetical protein
MIEEEVFGRIGGEDKRGRRESREKGEQFPITKP